MTQPEAGKAFLFNRPFGPQCLFACPRGRGTCSVEVEPTPGAIWKKHGSDAEPTLTPSIHCVRGCGWHGYVQKGKLVDAPGAGIATQLICLACDEPAIVTFTDGRPLMLALDRRQIVFRHVCGSCSTEMLCAVDPPPGLQLIAR